MNRFSTLLNITENSEQILNITENSEHILNITENFEQILNITEQILNIIENSEHGLDRVWTFLTLSEKSGFFSTYTELPHPSPN